MQQSVPKQKLHNNQDDRDKTKLSSVIIVVAIRFRVIHLF